MEMEQCSPSTTLPVRSSQKKRARNFFRAQFRLVPSPRYWAKLLLNDRVQLALANCVRRCSAYSDLAVQRAICESTEVTGSGHAGIDGSSCSDVSAVDCAAQVDAGGKKLVATVSATTGYRIREVVIQQTSVGGGGHTRFGPPKVLELECISDRRVCAEVPRFRRSNRANCRCGRGLVGSHSRAQEIGNRNGRDDQNDRHHDQQLD